MLFFKKPDTAATRRAEIKINKKKNGDQESLHFSIDTEDIIAVFAGFIAVVVALGMLFGTIPVNALTVSILGFSGVGGAISKIIGARKKRT